MFDEFIYFAKYEKVFALSQNSQGGSTLFSISLKDKKIELIRHSTGDFLVGKKLFKDIFESFLAIQLDDLNFIAITDLDTDRGRDVGGVVKLSESKVKRIIGLRVFKMANVIACGSNGTVVKYDIINGKKISFISSLKLGIEKDEEVDNFEISHDGQVIAFTTQFKAPDCRPKRLILEKIEEWKKATKSWVFDFTAEAEKFCTHEKFSNFHKIYLNFHIDKSPLIVAIQGNSRGKNCHIFAGMIKEDKLEEVAYVKDIIKGDYIDSDCILNNVYILDSLGNLRVVKLPLVKS